MSDIPTLNSRLKDIKDLLSAVPTAILNYKKLPGSGPIPVSLMLNEFLDTPLIKSFTKPPPTQEPDPSHLTQAADLASITSTLQQLTKAVNGLQSKATRPSTNKANPPKGRPPPVSNPPPTYSAIAGSGPKAASIILDLAQTKSGHAFRPRPIEVCGLINDALKTSPHQQVRVAAVRWTAKGNLVVIGSPNVSLHQLQLASGIIAQAFIASYSAVVNPSPPPTRANVKWSKLLINGLPTGASDNQAPFNPDECHLTLAADNAAYAALTVTQKPSWVRPPSSYKPGSTSSLVVAFEDPDGKHLQSLLAARHLYAFGTRATVKKWKQKTPNPKTTRKDNQNPNESDDEVEIITRARSPTPQALPPVAAPETPLDVSNFFPEFDPPIPSTSTSHPTRTTRQTKARK